MAKSIKQNDLVTKGNILIEATYKLTLLEQKFIISAISTIRKDDEDFKPYQFSVKEFWDLLGLEGAPKYSEMRKMSKELMKKPLEIVDDNQIIQANWFASIVYKREQGSIEVTFAPVLKPYLLQLRSKFTSYHLENVLKMDSIYSIRLYELLKQNTWIGERKISVVELRRMIGAENVYKLYGDFKKRALVPAQEEINEKTDIHITFTEIKKGRAVDTIHFNMVLKDTVAKQDYKANAPRKGRKVTRQEIIPKWLGKDDEEVIETEEIKEMRRDLEERLKKYQ